MSAPETHSPTPEAGDIAGASLTEKGPEADFCSRAHMVLDVSYFAFYCCHKDHDQSPFGRESVYSAYTS